jgi:hypothetical protein
MFHVFDAAALSENGKCVFSLDIEPDKYMITFHSVKHLGIMLAVVKVEVVKRPVSACWACRCLSIDLRSAHIHIGVYYIC